MDTAEEQITDIVVRPGDTCWRRERADRMAVIIDASDYFRHLKTSILKARRSILLVGWDFDTRVELERGGDHDGVPNEVGELLRHVVRTNPGLRVNVLRWDLAFLKMPLLGTIKLLALDWFGHRRLKIRLDSHHPAGACHHQKIVVIDGAIAFCGGIDVTIERWDTPEHRDDHPWRVRPDGTPQGPWHDVTTAVDGAAARALGDLARSRWHAATGETLPPAHLDGTDPWPDGLDPGFRDVDVGIARTCPAFEDSEAVREIEALYLAAIAAARRTIYLESQYHSAPKISRAIERRLGEADGPEVVVINPSRADGWLEETVMGSARALLVDDLRRADRHGRLRFMTPVTAAGADIYVHAKVLVIDDRVLRVGSSNINNRSMGLDSECDLAVEARPDMANAAEVRAAVTGVRDTLLAEHLGVAVDEWRRALAAANGSLVAAIDALAGTRAKTLVAFDPPALSEIERAIGETHFLDPDGTETMSPAFVKAMRALPSRGTIVTVAAAAVVAAAVWRTRSARRR